MQPGVLNVLAHIFSLYIRISVSVNIFTTVNKDRIIVTIIPGSILKVDR